MTYIYTLSMLKIIVAIQYKISYDINDTTYYKEGDKSD